MSARLRLFKKAPPVIRFLGGMMFFDGVNLQSLSLYSGFNSVLKFLRNSLDLVSM